MISLAKSKTLLFLICLLSVFLFNLNSYKVKHYISKQCEPIRPNNSPIAEIKHAQGLLWKVSKAGKDSSYLYGTIHVSDPEVTTLTDQVSNALEDSDFFVMEALPDTAQMMSFSRTMFFNDGQLLSSFVDAPIYEKTKEILHAYKLSSDSVSIMKPWAAFLIMNYPPDQGEPLDMVLLSLAKLNSAEVAGLESLKEQADIFTRLSMEDQVMLLTDTVCHYDLVVKDFEVMKSIYLEQDLASLYNYVHKNSMSDKPMYQRLMEKLIDERNYIMTERMQRYLNKGNAFIAIGAMHLPGKEGVLSRLEKKGYSVTAIY